jgi:hypothetical protein
MNIGIPVARYHTGNTGEYVQRALTALGHAATVLTIEEFFAALCGSQFDYFFCVDSSEPIPLDAAAIAGRSLSRVGFWFIDYRHNKNRPTRMPNDFANARLLEAAGGWIFQSQREDVEDCLACGLSRVSWLPLAADPEIWAPEPTVPKEFHIGFVGNVWDLQRKTALEILIQAHGLRVGFLGHGAVWKDDAAALLRKSWIGFNISTFFGEPVAFDVNMRVFETLSCGLPLFTNQVPSLNELFPADVPFIRTYTSLETILPRLREVVQDPAFLAAGAAARLWILDHGTYEHRMRDVIGRIPQQSRVA